MPKKKKHFQKTAIMDELVNLQIAAASLHCPVCMEPMYKMTISPCGHRICYDCTIQLSTCPVCKHPKRPDTIVTDYLMQPGVKSAVERGTVCELMLPYKEYKAHMEICATCLRHELTVATKDRQTCQRDLTLLRMDHEQCPPQGNPFQIQIIDSDDFTDEEDDDEDDDEDEDNDDEDNEEEAALPAAATALPATAAATAATQ